MSSSPQIFSPISSPIWSARCRELGSCGERQSESHRAPRTPDLRAGAWQRSRYRRPRHCEPHRGCLGGFFVVEPLGEREAGTAIFKALQAVTTEGRVRTPDLGGENTTEEFTSAVVQKLEA